MTRHHLIISGTGRAGTTFLVQLLTELGLDTGFQTSTPKLSPIGNAGMEWDLRAVNAPYVVKSPWLCDYLGEVLEGGDVIVDHAIIPVRELHAAAESRRDVHRRSGPTARPQEVPGGLWHTDEPAEQEAILTRQLYKLMYELARHDVPLTLLVFPRLAREGEYLYRRLAPALPGVSREAFLGAFAAVARPEVIHDF